MKDFVTIATFNTAMEAEIARTMLDSHSIHAHLLDATIVSITTNVGSASGYGSVRLCVVPKDVERAGEVIKEYRKRERKDDAPKVIPSPADRSMRCPACGSDAVEKRMSLSIVAVMFLLSASTIVVIMESWIGLSVALPLLIVLFFMKRPWYCMSCYHSWKISNKA